MGHGGTSPEREPAEASLSALELTGISAKNTKGVGIEMRKMVIIIAD